MKIPKVSLYRRTKKADKGYRYIRINLGPGRRPSELAPPYYLRYTAEDGSQPWTPVSGPLEAAMAARDKFQAMLEAKAKGVSVPELDAETNANRTPIAEAVRKFLESKSRRARSTVKAYTLHLNEFLLFLGRKKKYIDEIEAGDLRGFMDFMHKKGHAGKTQYNRVLTVLFLLKRNAIPNPLPWDDMPTIEEDPAIPYTPDELKAIFAAMDDEERMRYMFFLGTAARDQEVKYAAWTDIDSHSRIFNIRKKDDVGFFPKNHEARAIPIPADLVKMLQSCQRNPPHDRWIFVNDDEKPDGHFLRKLKRIALNAGLNCGHCTKYVQKGRGPVYWIDRSEEYWRDECKRIGLSVEEIETLLSKRREFIELFGPGRTTSDRLIFGMGVKTADELLVKIGKKKKVSCKTAPVCEKWILHRFRKTCATRWHENGIPVRTIQKWLGHKKLETTVKYLGLADLKDPKTRAQVDASFAEI
jgi:integrase